VRSRGFELGQDANRYGYDNGWTQTLSNFVSLTGAAVP
jgi:hypothetical protein